MIKSWLIFLLPDDEYKRQQVVYFLAEAVIISIISFAAMFLINQLSNVNFDVEVILGLGVIIPIFYVLIRYTLSGIEYTDVSTTKQYHKQKRAIIIRTISFVIIFSILYSLSTGLSKLKEQWLNMIGLLLLLGFFKLLIDYISLKRSYNKRGLIIQV